MNKTVLEFFEREKTDDITLEMLPNGTKYNSSKCEKFKTVHEIYKPLNDEQISFLQSKLHEELPGNTQIFPEWYIDFLKTTNGCNLFFDQISLYGDQMPAEWSDECGEWIQAELERDDPDWMAPYNLCVEGTAKYDEISANRWLVIGAYDFDHTDIAWDYKTNKIVAMYTNPETLKMKEWKKMKEADYENKICATWDSFEDFFVSETARLKAVIEKYGVLDNFEKRFAYSIKSLPVGHKNYEE